jgi:hypothetical protein
MIKKTWKEFRECKLLWWVNRSLHLFGWAIVIVQEEDGTISDCYPARVQYRGFSEDAEDEGFTVLTQHLAADAETLVADVAPSPENVRVDATGLGTSPGTDADKTPRTRGD